MEVNGSPKHLVEWKKSYPRKSHTHTTQQSEGSKKHSIGDSNVLHCSEGCRQSYPPP